LDLTGNPIAELPPEIEQLPNLSIRGWKERK
jgi:hypothetical protein